MPRSPHTGTFTARRRGWKRGLRTGRMRFAWVKRFIQPLMPRPRPSAEKTLRKGAERGIMRQVEMQRRHCNIAFFDGLQIGSVVECMLDRIEPEPVIAIAARIAPFDHLSARIIVKTLPHH